MTGAGNKQDEPETSCSGQTWQTRPQPEDQVNVNSEKRTLDVM